MTFGPDDDAAKRLNELAEWVGMFTANRACDNLKADDEPARRLGSAEDADDERATLTHAAA